MAKYVRLRPFTDIDVCECEQIDRLLLVYMQTDNPINCFKCRKEVDPERLNLSARMADDIASCFRVFGALYELWLDSGEYEVYAKERLLDRTGQVNLTGMKLASELTSSWPTYYWWFYDTEDGEPSSCPNCGQQLDENVYWGAGRCDACHVVV